MRPVRVSVGGIEYDDPYTWLEEESAETRAWQAAQNAVAERDLRGVEGFDALKELLEQHIGATVVSAPHGCGERWLRMAHGEGGEGIEVAGEPAGPWRTVLEAGAFSEPGRTASLDWFFPSPNGRYVAFGVSWGGDEQCVLRLLDVEREEVLPVAVPETWYSRVAWLPDSSGFFFPAGPYDLGKARDLLFLRPGDETPTRESLRRGRHRAGIGGGARGLPAGVDRWTLARARQRALRWAPRSGAATTGRRVVRGARGSDCDAGLWFRRRRRLRRGGDRRRPARPPRALPSRDGARPLDVGRGAARVRRGPRQRRPRRRALRGGQPR